MFASTGNYWALLTVSDQSVPETESSKEGNVLQVNRYFSYTCDFNAKCAGQETEQAADDAVGSACPDTRRSRI